MKWIVKESVKENFKSYSGKIVRVFSVTKNKDSSLWRVLVHDFKGSKDVACASCQGLLVAMSSSCPHALAVKRFLKTEGAQSTQEHDRN